MCSLKSCSRDGGVIRLTSLSPTQTQTTTEATFWGPKKKKLLLRNQRARLLLLLGTYEMHERPRHWSSSPASKKTCAKNMARSFFARPADEVVVIAALPRRVTLHHTIYREESVPLALKISSFFFYYFLPLPCTKLSFFKKGHFDPRAAEIDVKRCGCNIRKTSDKILKNPVEVIQPSIFYYHLPLIKPLHFVGSFKLPNARSRCLRRPTVKVIM